MSEKRSMMVVLSIPISFMLNISVLICPTEVVTDRSSIASSVLSDTPWPDDTFCFIAYGDTRGDNPGNVSPLHEEIVGLYLEHDPELILHTGDLVYHGGEWYQYADFNDSIQLIWDYEVPLFSAAGNHELYTDDWVNDLTFTNYTNFVDYSDIATVYGGTELYYSFDANGTHFIFLNTEHDWNWTEPAEYTCSDAQMAWLEADLATTDVDDFIIAVFHRPPFGSWDSPTSQTIRDDFHPLFVSHGVDLVFNGHEHLYYRTAQDGIYYVVIGGGGAPLHHFDGPVWHDGDVAFSDHHYCVGKYESGYLNVEVFLLNGTIRDSFSFLLTPETAPTTTATTSTSTATTTTITIDLPPDNMMLYLAITGSAVVIVLVLGYVLFKRK